MNLLVDISECVRCAGDEIPMLLVLKQLAVPAGQSVTGLTEKFQWLLLVDGTENRPLS